MKNLVKTPTVFQMEFTECGAASLAMILAYYGKRVPLEQLRVEAGVSRDGCNAVNILKAAKKFGLEAKAFRKEPDGLRKMKMPCIIHWEFNHFVVLEGFSGDSVFINDPALGRRRITYKELDESFTGVVLSFDVTDSFEKSKRDTSVFELMKKRMTDKGVIAKLIFLGILSVFPGLVLSVISQVFLDDVLGSKNTAWFTQLLVFLCVAYLVQIALSYYRGSIFVKLQKKTALLSGRDFLYKLFRLPISFFDQRSAGDLCGRVSNNEKISDFVVGDFASMVLSIFTAVFYLVLLIIYDASLTVIAVISVIVNIIIVRLTSDFVSNSSIKLSQEYGKFASTLCSGLSITDTLKASGAENEFLRRLLGFSSKTINTEHRVNKVQQIISAVPSTFQMLVNVLILFIGGNKVIEGKMTVGQLVAFTTLFGSFSAPVNSLVGFVKTIQTTKADICRVEDIMNYATDEKFDTAEKDDSIKGKLDGNIEVRNASFGYSILKPPIVSDFSFKIKCGQSIAFVGSSGCGKSTVSKLVSGLYKPWGGEIFFDGYSADTIPDEVIKSSVSTVSQQITLFSGSIRDNITMWNRNISESDMIAAAKDACIHDVISQKPGGYDFALAENGSNFSGGQKQRLEIARALATNPTVLIMDEATSALDPIVEKKIMDNIKRRGCSCVVVAHRLSAIRDCDMILVMQDGRIIEHGTHDELISRSGVYSNFVKTV